MTKRSASLLVVALGSSLAAQQPAPTFKSNVNAIVLDVRVVDAVGRFVGDLTRDDLQVFEDGREQNISTFDVVNIPVRPIEPPRLGGSPVDADVASNAPADSVEQSSRYYVLLLDDIHTDPTHGVDVRRQATDFVEHHLSYTDRAVVTTTSGRLKERQEFTNNRGRLLDAIAQFQGLLHTDIPIPPCVADPPYCATEDERLVQYTLTSIANWLAPLGGRRKAILFFGQGAAAGTITPEITVPDDPNAPGVATGGLAAQSTVALAAAMYAAILPDRRQTAAATARANVAIYSIDPRHEADAFLDRIVRDTSSYYLLGFVPTNDRRDGTFRKLDIRVRRPGLTVEARTGYTSENDSTSKNRKATDVSPALAALVATPAATSGLTMSIAAPVFRANRSKASVELIVDVSGHDLAAASEASGGKDSLELLAVVADSQGHIKASEHGSLGMQLTPATRAAVSAHGVRVLSRLDVAPGRYLLRVAALDAGGGTRGSVQYDLDVPDFAKAPLAMSGLTLAAASELARPTTGSDKAWKQRFNLPPTAARTFAVDDEIAVSGEIYSSDAKTAVVTTRLERESGEVVFGHTETLSGGGARDAAFHHNTEVALGGMEPGNYVLIVQATNPSATGAGVSRRIPIVVRSR